MVYIIIKNNVMGAIRGMKTIKKYAMWPVLFSALIGFTSMIHL